MVYETSSAASQELLVSDRLSRPGGLVVDELTLRVEVGSHSVEKAIGVLPYRLGWCEEGISWKVTKCLCKLYHSIIRTRGYACKRAIGSSGHVLVDLLDIDEKA